MHGVIAYSGDSPQRFQQLMHAAEHFGASDVKVRNSGQHWLGSFGSTHVVLDFEDADGFGSVFGSAAKTAQYLTHNFLDNAPDDAVGCAVNNEVGLVIGAGRGNHKMFIHYISEYEVLASSSLAVLAFALRSTTIINREYEDFDLGFGFLPGTLTVYSGIQSIAPGTRVIVSKQLIEPTIVPKIEVPQVTSFAEAIPQLYDVFIQAIKTLAGSRTRHAVLLGGFDSMLVAATLRNLGHEVHTYTFSFGDPHFEQRNVHDFVQSLGIIHHPVKITPELVEKTLREFGRYFYQVGAQAHYQIQTLIASQQILDDDHEAIFNGDGCDAIFLSYPTVNRRASISSKVGKAPVFLKKALLLLLQTQFAERKLGHVGRIARSVVNNSLLPDPARGHLPTRYFDDFALKQLRLGIEPTQTETMLAMRMRLAAPTASMDTSRRAFHGNGLTAQSKVKVDGAVGKTGLPHLSPYLHPEFRAFVSSLPIEYLKNQSASPAANGKELLVAMVRQYGLLPELFIGQPKQSPVDSPVDDWYMTCLKAQIISQLHDLPFEVNQKYVETILKKKVAEEWYREKVSIGHHAFQAIGLLASYASFNRILKES